MKTLRQIFDLIYLILAPLVIAMFVLKNNTLTMTLLTIILISILFEFLFTKHIKKQLKEKLLQAIEIRILTKRQKNFWLLLLFFHIIALSIFVVFSDFIWISMTLVNIYFCLNYVYFINQTNDFILYDHEKIILIKFIFKNKILFKSISEVRLDSKNIIITSKDKKEKSYKYPKEISEKIIELIENKTLPNNV